MLKLMVLNNNKKTRLITNATIPNLRLLIILNLYLRF